ncbi:hypothetical protein P3W45_000398 [Vairimorpha bombi]|jgi:farnesyl diphosphate synthase
MTDLLLPIYSRIRDLCIDYNTTRIVDMVHESVQGTKFTRSLMYNHVLRCYQNSSEDSSYRDNDDEGFLFEMFHGSLCIGDDIMDNSNIRRGRPCYYLKRGMKGLRDSKFLIGLVNKLMDSDCVLIFRDTFFTTCIGQTLDTKNKKREEYILHLYKKICEYKTGAYSVYLPLACGYIMSNKKIPEYLYDLSFIVGIIYQMQDDFINFYPERSKKSESDLEEKKLTFFTCLLSREEDDRVNEYFESGILHPYIREKVFSYFDVYYKELNTMIKATKDMVKDEDKEVLKVVYDILDIYLNQK